ncbi:MAG: SusC/RagA family TonB-linked outer membrane protein, partial [Bacteroidota bacterium]
TLASRAVYQNYLDYRTKFGKLNFAGVAGVDYETLDFNNTSLAGTGFPSDDFTFLASAADFTDASQDVSESRLLSLYTRLNFRYLGKYALTATFRSDGSSRFGADNRFGYFPSVSLGWILHEEPFLQNLDWVNQLKLRVSYGLTGNQAGIGDFASRGLASGGNNYQGLAGISPVTFANVDLQWESTSELNLGLDFGIWGDRLHGSVDYYVKNTRDLLLLRPLPSSTGFEGINQNVGEIRNAGVELGLTGLIVDRDVRWTLRGMLAANRNEVTALFEGQGFSPVTFLPIRVDEGEPLAYFFGLRSLGVDPQTGDLIFEDVNGDGEIDDADNQRIGSPHPDFIGSLSSELTYKGLSLDVLVNFLQGNEILNFTRTFTEDGLLNGFNNSTRILDAWSAPGDVTDVPRIGGPNATANRNSRTSR